MRDSDDAPVEIVFVEPLTVRISTAVKLTGISRSRIYELNESGDLDTVKVGRSTLIPFKSLQIERASRREGWCQTVKYTVGAGSFENKMTYMQYQCQSEDK